ncbi:phosphatidylinositol N-acetylglucosaminyltransferase [Auriculariales sp. MPI-PUGE-AT-0066]|nr:phosphatidylinositol N-acetylglucosaminyltransferase [Auriculariales sp. MPI-PUGE-AT-0066]
MSDADAQPWEKVLWRAQPYPDNYVPESFLDKRRTNANFRPYSFLALVLASCAVTQHLSTIFIFVSVFIRLLDESLDARGLSWIALCAQFLGSVVWDLTMAPQSTPGSATRAKATKSSVTVFLALIGLSPVLKTLTAATSSDSIWSLSAGLFCLNALLADYTAPLTVPQAGSGLISVLSMNAAISASVVLASRLPTNQAVFALTVISIQLFALFPMARRHLQTSSLLLHVVLAVVLASIAVAMMLPISPLTAVLFLSVLLFVTFGGPALLMWAQQFKNEIRGPWDVATPKVRHLT